MWARWRGALGLRGRILGVVLVTSVATLAVAAVTLLGPLEQSLRNAELNTLRGQVGSTKYSGPKSIEKTVTPFKQINPALVPQADILPVRQPTGGAAINPDAGRHESPCADAPSSYLQEVCLHKQGMAARHARVRRSA